MKNNDANANKRLKSVLAMILATCIAIGLMSSTAIKLATATYLMQSSKKTFKTNIPFVDNLINDIVNPTPDTTAAPTDAPTEAQTEATTEATTKATEASKDTTKATTEATTKPDGQTIAEKQSILKSYTDVVSLAKTKKPAKFTKVTTRTVSTGFLTGLFWGDVAKSNPDYFTTEVTEGADIDLLCINNELTGCLIDATKRDQVSEAVKSASREEVDGEQIKVVIDFNDASNPAPLKSTDKKAKSFISGAFPVITAEEFRLMIDNAQSSSQTETVTLKYTGCQIEAIYNPRTGEISYIKQTTKFVADATDGLKKASFTVTEVSEYTNFQY